VKDVPAGLAELSWRPLPEGKKIVNKDVNVGKRVAQ
jgi:hypothetical protein